MGQYPWVNFEIDLRDLPVKTWMQLGECLSKCVHISRVPLSPDIAGQLHTVYLVKGVQATTAIEGNTLTEEEIRLRIDKKLKLPPSKEYLGREVDNILQLCNEIGSAIHRGEAIPIAIGEICRYNKIVLQNIPSAQDVVPGEFRSYSVGVGTYRGPDFSDVPQLMKQLCDWLNSEYFLIDKDQPIINSIIKAIIAHLYIAWIHPFGDGNGRVARILEFAILLNSGIPTPAAHLMSNHYNTTRSEYYRQLELASKSRNVNGFISYAVQGFLDGLKEQLHYIFNFIIDISWESFIYETFRNYKHHEVTTKRRRTLILELSRQKEPVQKENLTTMSQSTMDAYRTKTQMTIERDLKELENLDLIERTDKGYAAKKDRILALLPVRAR